MTAEGKTPFSGQEPGPHRNPDVQDVRPADPGKVPPVTDPKQTRFSAAAITGMVLASIGWAIAFRPLTDHLSSYLLWRNDFSFYDFFAFAGLTALLGGVTGFIVALATGNKRLAARLYIIPSLIWQGVVSAFFILLIIALSSYDGT
ncbi:hypothetical protein J2M53_10005 [Arthrobacter sp. zg-ZUI100]|uniref:hypothetical protein n=1 Tax=Arthrobacter jiangjiafuii TaxID=2817475 RepID=UPI001AEE0E12|nr:hypothetical protein [Arthrobacter jiangjiafuii]MBP3036583.1 hypothetical protein [Arthrobacter jiangjiafuii]